MLIKGVQKKVNFLNLIKNHRNNLARSLKIYQMLDINPQFHIQSRKMHPDVKIKLKKEIEVFLEKNPESNVSDLRRFLKLGSTGDLIAQFKKSSFSMFLKRNYEKFKETGSCSQHKCGNGRKKRQLGLGHESKLWL